MERESVWLGVARVVTVAAGLSMAGLATAATACADTGPTRDTDSVGVSGSADKSAAENRSRPTRRTGSAADTKADRAEAGASRKDRALQKRTIRRWAAAATEGDRPDASETPAESVDPVASDTAESAAEAPSTPTTVSAQPPSVGKAKASDKPEHTEDGPPVRSTADNGPQELTSALPEGPAEPPAGVRRADKTVTTVAVTVVESVSTGPQRSVPDTGAAPTAIPERATATAVLTAGAATVTSRITAAAESAVRGIAAVVFAVIAGLERLLVGPPTLPAGSTVTVRSSSLQIGDGLSVPADWYFPAGDDPPEQLILLQHGFFAVAPMYSHTAARLAEETNSIVVTPTITSNPLAAGGLWINGEGMHEAIAALFTGDRAALTASALAAGYAEQYQLDAADAVLPREFVLAGHSAGGALVSVAAGYVITSDAADDLMGVLLLDGVTTDDQLSATLDKLDAYQQQTGRYVPVREIGAPSSSWNSISNVNSALSSARPDRFNGVVLSGGVHTDSMGGGSAISEFLVRLLAGNPIAQNPPALQQLAVAWVNEWFAGVTGAGDELEPGSTISIATPAGTAVGVVIGTPVAAGVHPQQAARAA